MFEIGLVIQARMESTRLPKKVLKDLCGKPILKHIIDSLENINDLYKIIVITSNKCADDPIENFCLINNVLCFRGSELDVLDRYYQTAIKYNLDHIVRITADNPIIDLENLLYLIEQHVIHDADYSSNKSIVNSGLPKGIGSEIYKFEALKKSWTEGLYSANREHTNDYILTNPNMFKILEVKSKNYFFHNDINLSIDTREDFIYVENIFNILKNNNLEVNLKNIYNLFGE
jgi:spore coat polysaccharide biosynthesis protein SpsF